MHYNKHKIRVCDLGDCFANTNYRCKMLDTSIYDNCPFYKVGKMDMERYADIKSYRYAVDRAKKLQAIMDAKEAEWRKAREEWESAKAKRDEAERWKRRLKTKIKERIAKLDRN